jgi:hypothetical protein
MWSGNFFCNRILFKPRPGFEFDRLVVVRGEGRISLGALGKLGRISISLGALRMHGQNPPISSFG